MTIDQVVDSEKCLIANMGPILDSSYVVTWEQLSAQLVQGKRGHPWGKREITRIPSEGDSHFYNRLMYSYLVSQGMRIIGQSPDEFANESLIAMFLFHEHVTSALAYAKDRAGKAPLSIFSTDEILLRYFAGVCRRAARWALENFDRQTYVRMQANAKRAGSATKYGLSSF